MTTSTTIAMARPTERVPAMRWFGITTATAMGMAAASVAKGRGFRHPRSAAHLVHVAAQHRSGDRASRAEVYFHAALEAIETCDG